MILQKYFNHNQNYLDRFTQYIMTFQTDCINAHKLQDLWENGGNFTDLRIKMTTQDVFVHSVIIHARSYILSKLKTRDDAKEICFPVNVSEKSVLTSVKHIYFYFFILFYFILFYFYFIFYFIFLFYFIF